MSHLFQFKGYVLGVILIIVHVIYSHGFTTTKDTGTCFAIFENSPQNSTIILYSDKTFYKKNQYNLGGTYGTWSICGDTLTMENDIETLVKGDSTLILYYNEKLPSDYGFPTLEDDVQIYPAEDWPFISYVSRKFIYKKGAFYSKVPGSTDEYYQSYKQIYPDPQKSYYLCAGDGSIDSIGSVLKLGK